jgi:branched-chain amino acid transport system substrate-binding protein
MLASAVLLSAINTQLTDVGYTTAIEYGFYGFFAMCLFCVVTALTVERLHAAKMQATALRFDVVARFVYAASVAGLFAAYALSYSF